MIMQRKLIGVCTAFLLVVAFHAAAQQQKRLALVIGNADYTNAPYLRNPTHDARAMSEKLGQLGFKVITVINGTYRQMATAEDSFATELNRYNVGLFYYSGHGVQYQGTNYLVPVNANIKRAIDIQFEALNATQVLSDMESAGTSVNIMILDACRNNPFATEFRSMSRGLSVVQAPAGSMVVYSTAPDHVAMDGSGYDSPFTGALLKYIETPGVSIQDMLTSVFQRVQQETQGKQIPWESSSLTTPFYFNSSGTSAYSPSRTSTIPSVVRRQEGAAHSVRSVAALEHKKAALESRLRSARLQRDRRGKAGATLSICGAVAGGAAVLLYFLSRGALSSLQSASTASEAATDLSRFNTEGALSLGGAVAGVGLMSSGVGLLVSMPSIHRLNREIETVDIQLQRISAEQSLPP